MPTTILHKESLIPGRTSKLVLDAPQIAATAKPGHFVMLRVNEQGERFPLTIADTDPEKGSRSIRRQTENENRCNGGYQLSGGSIG